MGSRLPNQAAASSSTAQNRQNEYFVPRNGIDREVITADICRYLGNDALVRPGWYDDKQSGRRIQGYFITAYRNLTTAMIEDLKADSARWEQERRNHSGARYSEQQYRSAGAASQYPGSDAPGYSAANAGNPYQTYPGQQGGYATSQYQTQPAYYQDNRYATQGVPGSNSYAQSYANHSPAPQVPDPYISTGANLQSYQQDAGRDVRMTDASAAYAPAGVPATSYSAAQKQGYAAYAPQGQTPYGSVPQQPVDPFYGRRAYNAPVPTSQAGSSEYVAAPTTQHVYSPAPEHGSSGQRRDRERDRERESDKYTRHHRR